MTDEHEQGKPIPFVQQRTDQVLAALNRIRGELDIIEDAHRYRLAWSRPLSRRNDDDR